jgi:hypothetical protein
MEAPLTDAAVSLKAQTARTCGNGEHFQNQVISWDLVKLMIIRFNLRHPFRGN